jgi:hypothetical protein
MDGEIHLHPNSTVYGAPMQYQPGARNVPPLNLLMRIETRRSERAQPQKPTTSGSIFVAYRAPLEDIHWRIGIRQMWIQRRLRVGAKLSFSFQLTPL